MRLLSLRQIALLATPFIILGMTPRTPFFSAGIAAASVFVVLVLNEGRVRARPVVLYCIASIIFLAISILRSQPISEYGLSKAVFLGGVILPFSWSVSALVRKPADVRWILIGFLLMAVIVGAGSVGLSDRQFLGPGRYQWQGNISAIGIIILLHRWIVQSPFIVVPLVLLLAVAVAIAAAKQAVGLLAVGLVVIVFVQIRRRGRGVGNLAIIGGVAILIAMSWQVILPPSVTNVMTFKLGQMVRPDGGVSFLQRGLLFEKAWTCFTAQPLTGVGLGKYEEQPGWTDETATDVHAYPHSVALEVLCEHGAIGFIVLLLPFVVLSARFLFRSHREDSEPYLGILLLFLLAATTASLTGDLASRPMWIFGALLIRLEFLPYERADGGGSTKVVKRSQKYPRTGYYS